VINITGDIIAPAHLGFGVGCHYHYDKRNYEDWNGLARCWVGSVGSWGLPRGNGYAINRDGCDCSTTLTACVMHRYSAEITTMIWLQVLCNVQCDKSRHADLYLDTYNGKLTENKLILCSFPKLPCRIYLILYIFRAVIMNMCLFIPTTAHQFYTFIPYTPTCFGWHSQP
jgi:hypothetical protein